MDLIKTDKNKLTKEIKRVHKGLFNPMVAYVYSPLGLVLLKIAISAYYKNVYTIVNVKYKNKEKYSSRIVRAINHAFGHIGNDILNSMTTASWQKFININFKLIGNILLKIDLKNNYRSYIYTGINSYSPYTSTQYGKFLRNRSDYSGKKLNWSYDSGSGHEEYIKKVIKKFKSFFDLRGNYQTIPGLSSILEKSAIFDLNISRNLWIVCLLPKKINLNNDRLDSITEPCIEFKDGLKFYAIKDVEFPEKLFKQILKGTYSPKELFSLKNIEQRRIAFEIVGPDKFMKILNNPKLICKSEKTGYELYVAYHKMFNNDYRCFIKYECPSTGRKYIKFINNRKVLREVNKYREFSFINVRSIHSYTKFNQPKIVDTLMANTHNMTLKQFDEAIHA